MAADDLRKPLTRASIEKVPWVNMGGFLRVDPEVESLKRKYVYRYVPIAEALMLFRGEMQFSHPRQWPDKYESNIAEKLFCKGAPFGSALPYVKCFSLEYASEAMWRVYGGRGGVVRVGMSLASLLGGLAAADWSTNAKVYVGRVRYMDGKRIRSEIERIARDSPKKAMGFAVPALLMKRAAFWFENEIRVAFLPPARKKTTAPGSVLVSGFPTNGVNRVLVDPYLPAWQADELCSLFKTVAPRGVEVKQSKFDEHPDTFSQDI